MSPMILKTLLAVRDGIRRSTIASGCVYHILRIGRTPSLDAGWLRSFREGRSVDANGNPLPWIVYEAIRFLDDHATSEMTVFEYGAGNSTRWWASRVAKVTSCENDQAWVNEISPTLPPNATVRYVPLTQESAYTHAAVGDSTRYDIIVVDGRMRVECVRNCLPALKPRGLLVLDNSERRIYHEAMEFMEENGFKRTDFSGIGPIATIQSTTSIFQRP